MKKLFAISQVVKKAASDSVKEWCGLFFALTLL